MKHRQARQRGIALVIALIAVLAVTTSVAILAKNQSDAATVVVSTNQQRRARTAALAGIQRAMTELQILTETPEEPITNSDNWALLGSNGGDAFLVGSTSFRLQILDACSRLDINMASQDQLLALNLTTEQVDSLLDWREAGAAPRGEGGKDEYYNQLDRPYNSAQTDFQCVNELLNVKGFTPETLYALPQNTISTGATAADPVPLITLLGIDALSPNNAPDGNGRINLNQQGLNAQQLAQNAQIPLATAQQILEARNARPGRTFDSMTQVFQVPGVSNNPNNQRNVLDRCTTSNLQVLRGRINVNTAPVEVLSTIPGITPDLAQSMVDNRGRNPYRQLSDLLNVSANPAFVGSLADFTAVSSQSFIVRVIGRAGEATYAAEATVILENGLPIIRRIEEASVPQPESAWGWDPAENEIQLL